MFPYWHKSVDRANPPTEEDARFLVSDLTFQVKAGLISISEFSIVCRDVYKASSWRELDCIADKYLADPAPGGVPSQLPRGSGPLDGYGFNLARTMSSVISGKNERLNRAGVFDVPIYEQIVKQSTDIIIDYSAANFPMFASTLDVSLRFGSLKVLLPPGMGFDYRLIGHPSDISLSIATMTPGLPRLILTGVVEGTDIRAISTQN